jgi:hypothetical protein
VTIRLGAFAQLRYKPLFFGLSFRRNYANADDSIARIPDGGLEDSSESISLTSRVPDSYPAVPVTLISSTRADEFRNFNDSLEKTHRKCAKSLLMAAQPECSVDEIDYDSALCCRSLLW